MSRLLMLTPSDPWTLDSGARIRNAALIQALRADHTVDVLTPPTRARSPTARALDLATSELPDMAHRLWSQPFAQHVRLRANAYDAVQAEGVEMARYLWQVPPAQRVYDAHNAEFLLQRRLAESSSAVAAAYSRVQSRRLERFERQIVRGSRLTLAVSEHDANQLLALAGPDANVQVVPNAIDVRRYTFREPTDEVPPNVLFLGKLDFRPNADALAWFIPDVVQQLDGLRLFAVGAEPPGWLVSSGQHDERIAVTGYVDDERPYFARCAALVLPLRTGGGSRLKALVAMASGLPIISTRLGIEGLEAEPERHFVLAESPAEWIASVRRVISDASLRRDLACNARALVEQRYDWSGLRARLQQAYAWLAS